MTAAMVAESVCDYAARDTPPSAAELAKERDRHLKEAKELKLKLESGRQAEFAGLVGRVEEFNRIFDTHYALVDGSPVAAAPKAPRLCTLCQQSGHNKKNCPTKGAAAQ
jgi:hypothetical protein